MTGIIIYLFRYTCLLKGALHQFNPTIYLLLSSCRSLLQLRQQYLSTYFDILYLSLERCTPSVQSNHSPSSLSSLFLPVCLSHGRQRSSLHERGVRCPTLKQRSSRASAERSSSQSHGRGWSIISAWSVPAVRTDLQDVGENKWE